MDIALQTALYIYLTTGSPLQSYSVYDDVPQVPSYPYVRIGETTVMPFDTDESQGLEITVTLHTWSQYDGNFEVKTIQLDLYNRLHRQESLVSVAGYNTVGITLDGSDVFLDEDGETRHGITRFRIILEEV